MVVGMGAGVQARAACCPCCSSPSTSASPSSSSSSSSRPCLAPPRLAIRLRFGGNIGSSSVRKSVAAFVSSTRCGLLDYWSSDSWNRWRQLGSSGSGSGASFRAWGSEDDHHQGSRRSVRLQVVPNSSLAERSSELGDGQEESVDEDADLASITEWELDFCSRPIVDSRGKKVWELVVCDSERQLRFTRFYPNNVINSGTLRDALVYIIDNFGLPKPQKIRFFRSQMQTIIGKACAELDIQPVPSQRCIQLVRWLGERYESVYRQHPGFQEGAGPLLLLEEPLAVDVPETLQGEQWAFVQLPFSAVLEEIAAVEKGENFGSVFDVRALGIDIPPDAMVPGVAVASSRATPLAAWTNALELSSIDIDVPRSCLILSSGVSERWRYAFWPRSTQGDQEAQAWENAKSQAGGLHFLAVQQSLDSELCAGFWLLVKPPKPPV